MKDILNKRVKFRESFRPFAAIVLEDDVGKYFDHSTSNPYMLMVYKVKKNIKIFYQQQLTLMKQSEFKL